MGGQAEELTETHIAEEVFRREGYNPAEDNLVRAAVRQLRLKLKEYFETEGKDDAFVAELPKGSYMRLASFFGPLRQFNLAHPK
ncbi:MAG: hypothetical protein ACRD34_07990 [Bryobacteraceae bacterium]